MQTLYPSIKVYAQHTLNVAPPHQLYVEESGNPEGLPVLVIHSGPGAGCEEYYRRFFDPEVYRIILYDQRGAGKSKPHAELELNTTQALIDDMESLRMFLNIKQWVLFGGSWGSALALLYAEQHPGKVKGLILNRIFLARKPDIAWFYQHGASQIFPDYWEEFVQQIPKAELGDIVTAYHHRLTGPDELARMAAAKNWSLWQARCGSLQPHNNIIDHFSDPHFAVGLATIESHYFSNHCFIEENEILNKIEKIKDIPGFIIHGRYDMVCPLQCAWELHHAWPISELFIIRDAGHSLREPGIIDAIIIATQKMSKQQLPAC